MLHRIRLLGLNAVNQHDENQHDEINDNASKLDLPHPFDLSPFIMYVRVLLQWQKEFHSFIYFYLFGLAGSVVSAREYLCATAKQNTAYAGDTTAGMKMRISRRKYLLLARESHLEPSRAFRLLNSTSLFYFSYATVGIS